MAKLFFRKRGLRLRSFIIVDNAVAEGVNYGWRRAHKHTDNPDESTIIYEIQHAVMLALEEIINFEEDNG